MNNSESELMMPSVICDGYDSDQVFSDIQNPIALTPNGDEVQVKGCFIIKEI